MSPEELVQEVGGAVAASLSRALQAAEAGDLKRMGTELDAARSLEQHASKSQLDLHTLQRFREALFREVDNLETEAAARQVSVFQGEIGVELHELRLPGASVRVEVMGAAAFAGAFDHQAARAVYRLEGGEPVIYARPDAGEVDLLGVAVHRAQLDDLIWGPAQRSLNDQLGRWERLSPEERIGAYQGKLNLEIAAHYTLIEHLEARAGDDAEGLLRVGEAREDLGHLRALRERGLDAPPGHLPYMFATPRW